MTSEPTVARFGHMLHIPVGWGVDWGACVCDSVCVCGTKLNKNKPIINNVTTNCQMLKINQNSLLELHLENQYKSSYCSSSKVSMTSPGLLEVRTTNCSMQVLHGILVLLILDQGKRKLAIRVFSFSKDFFAPWGITQGPASALWIWPVRSNCTMQPL